MKHPLVLLRRMRVRQAIAPVFVAMTCGFLALAPAALSVGKPVDQYYVMTVQDLGGNQWQLGVVNTNPNSKFIGSFWWIPPVGMKVLSLGHVKGGTCSLGGNAISCKGNVAPPNCFTCVGSSMTMTFTASGDQATFVNTSYGGYYIHYGVLGYLNVTSLNSFGDVPACAKGQKSTKAKPCAAT
jgi:hypothetical protein